MHGGHELIETVAALVLAGGAAIVALNAVLIAAWAGRALWASASPTVRNGSASRTG